MVDGSAVVKVQKNSVGVGPGVLCVFARRAWRLHTFYALGYMFG